MNSRNAFFRAESSKNRKLAWCVVCRQLDCTLPSELTWACWKTPFFSGAVAYCMWYSFYIYTSRFLFSMQNIERMSAFIKSYTLIIYLMLLLVQKGLTSTFAYLLVCGTEWQRHTCRYRRYRFRYEQLPRSYMFCWTGGKVTRSLSTRLASRFCGPELNAWNHPEIAEVLQKLREWRVAFQAIVMMGVQP